MNTLHILRTEPDQEVGRLIRAIGDSEARQIALYDDDVDYEQLIDEVFSHDRVISWW